MNFTPTIKTEDYLDSIERMRFEGYESGHIMYLRSVDLASSNQHIRELIEASQPAEGEPAKYGRAA